MLPPRVLLPLVLSVALCGAIQARDYGKVVIAGGANGYGHLSSVETILGVAYYPDLPVRIADSTLTLVGSVLYNCGGGSYCYTLNTSSSDPQWLQTVTLPVSMYYHTAVAIGSHIWFLYYGFLYDLDTETNEFSKYQTLFEVDNYHCAVTDGEYSYVLGVGNNNREIWMNSVRYSPERWEHVGNLSFGRTYFGCLWLSNYLVSTGGNGAYNSTELFDINLGTSEITGELQTGRYGHGMFVYDSKPAVVGGYYSGEYFSSIETYDLKTGKWTTEEPQLMTARFLFGLAQFIGKDTEIVDVTQ